MCFFYSYDDTTGENFENVGNPISRRLIGVHRLIERSILHQDHCTYQITPCYRSYLTQGGWPATTAQRVRLDATTVSILHGNLEGPMYVDNFLVPCKSVSEDHVSICTSSFIKKYVNRRANKSEEPSLSTDGNARKFASI